MSPVETEKYEGPSARTISALVDDAAERLAAVGIDSPREDAEAIVADALGVKPSELSVDSADDVSGDVAAKIEAMVKKRVEREPLAYVLGRAPFRDLEIAVDPRVLWPRKETELLVEVGTRLPQGARVHEVGTGSGAIALALMSERPDLKITASDLSPEAVEAARENAERLGLDFDVRVAKGIPDDIGDVDMVIANLPYISDETIDQRSPEIHAEPLIAITADCGADGLGVIRGLIAETPSGTLMAMEHDTHHGPAMQEMLNEAETLRDYEGNERVSVGKAP
ncbi:MAG: N5-glutamine methyltransferase family protein [Solirubrobacterales bacterium]